MKFVAVLSERLVLDRSKSSKRERWQITHNDERLYLQEQVSTRRKN